MIGFFRFVKSASAPSTGSRKTCSITDADTQKGNSDFAVTTPSGPSESTVPFSDTAACASAVR